MLSLLIHVGYKGSGIVGKIRNPSTSMNIVIVYKDYKIYKDNDYKNNDYKDKFYKDNAYLLHTLRNKDYLVITFIIKS